MTTKNSNRNHCLCLLYRSEDLAKKFASTSVTATVRAKIADPLTSINFEGLNFGSSDDEEEEECDDVEGAAEVCFFSRIC